MPRPHCTCFRGGSCRSLQSFATKLLTAISASILYDRRPRAFLNLGVQVRLVLVPPARRIDIVCRSHGSGWATRLLSIHGTITRVFLAASKCAAPVSRLCKAAAPCPFSSSSRHGASNGSLFRKDDCSTRVNPRYLIREASCRTKGPERAGNR